MKTITNIFSSGIVPDSWLLGNIKPIYINKDDPLNPKKTFALLPFLHQFFYRDLIITLSSDDMQNQINYFYDFCMKWRLKVNIEMSIKI